VESRLPTCPSRSRQVPPLTAAQQASARCNAACTAARAAAAKTEGAARLDKEKVELRQQALTWLREALQIYPRLADAGSRGRPQLRQTLQSLQTDEDLASVREPEALAGLPAVERLAWQQFWSEVETLCQKAGPPKTP
jgi:hypothetical protein